MHANTSSLHARNHGYAWSWSWTWILYSMTTLLISLFIFLFLWGECFFFFFNRIFFLKKGRLFLFLDVFCVRYDYECIVSTIYSDKCFWCIWISEDCRMDKTTQINVAVINPFSSILVFSLSVCLIHQAISLRMEIK